MSAAKTVVILGIWGAALAGFYRWLAYMEAHELGTGYLRWPVFLIIALGLATFAVMENDA